MPVKGRNQPGNTPRPSAAPNAEAVPDDDLTRLSLGDLVQLPLDSETGEPMLQAEQAAQSPGDQDAVDFSTLSLEELLSTSVSGGEEQDENEKPKEDEQQAPVDDQPPADVPDGNDQGGNSESGTNGGASQFLELQTEPIDWLLQEEDHSLVAGYLGYFDQGLAPAGGAVSLQLIGGPETSLGNQPVPSAIPASQPDPIQTWFTPFAMNLIDGTIGEAWSAADAVGRVRVSGASDQVSYVLVDDAGGRFAIDGGSGDVTIVSGPFDFATQSGYTIMVEASDGAQTLRQSFTIQVSPEDVDGAGLPGTQLLIGATGNHDDVLFGGAGDDIIAGLNGNDRLYGGSGDDLLIGGNHDDVLYGGSGDDWLLGGNHDDRLYGGTGDDSLYGEGHDDMLFGGGGADELYGGDGGDQLYGQGGNDWLDGGRGSDALFGGADDDVLVWDANDTRIDGGDGNDELLVLAGDVDLTAFAGTLASIETVNLSSDAGPNTLTLTVADVLDMTDNGLLEVLGDDHDRVSADSGWILSRVDDSGYQLYLHSVGPAHVVGLLLGPDVQLDPQDGG
jgi:Ca2+-binding RTX toxin-like protein